MKKPHSERRDRSASGSRVQLSCIILLLLLSNLFALVHDSSADPTLQDNGDGTATATWTFQNPANYTSQNLSFGAGNVTLQVVPFQFIDSSQADFQQGTIFLNVDLVSVPGNITLSDTTAAGTPGSFDIGVDYGNGKDAYITAAGAGNKNYGASVELNVESSEPERVLIQFDLSAIGALNLITHAEIRLNLEWAASANPINVSAHQVTASWVEGAGDGNPTGDGVTWVSRDGVTNWVTPGGEFNATAEFVLTDVTNQTINHLWDITALADDWMTGTRTNYGAILMAEDQPYLESRKVFNSKEWGSPGRRPRLRVDYVTTEGGYANGSFVSRVMDGQSQVNWGNISWNSSQPSQTNLSLHTRSGDCAGSWSSWSPAYMSPLGSQITSPSDRCLQYKVEMETYNTTKTPVLEEVRIDYWKYSSEGILETEDFAPASWIGWEDFDALHNGPLDSNVTFSYSTDSGMSWTPVNTGESLQSVLSPSIRFMANLTTTDTSSTPTLFNMTITYAFYGSLDHIHMSLATWTGTADDVIDLDATGHDAFHNVVTFAQYWSTTDPTGTVDANGVYDPGTAGTWDVYCNNSDDTISNYTVVNVLPGVASRIGIGPWDPGTLTTDDMLFLNVSAYDSEGNLVGPVLANWTVAGGIGTITPGPNSSAVFDPTQPGIGTITADDGLGHMNTTNTIQVVAGSRSRVGIEPWSPGTLTADESVNFAAHEYDADGNMIGPANVTWAVNGGIGTIPAGPSETSLFEATTVGTGTVSIDDGLGHVNTTDWMTVVAGVLDTIQVLPSLVVVEHREDQDFTASGYDADGNIVAIVDSVWDTNAGTVVYSLIQNATLRAQDTSLLDGWIRITAILQNNITGTANVSVVVTNVNPAIQGTIPDQVKPEDYGSWSFDLSAFASDPQDPLSDLTWFFTDHDSSLTTISGDNIIGNHLITLTTVLNAYGSDELTIWLRDKDGHTDGQTLYVNITSVNDRPTIESITPFTVHHDVPYTYYFYDYVSDVETPKESLTLTSTDPDHISFNGLWGTFTYPEEYLNLPPQYPRIAVHDEDGGEMFTILAITISEDYVPVLTTQLPDITLYEGEEVINYFDLDDYFDDPDADSLFYTTGNIHVDITINEDHTVDFIAPMDWSGQETVTFRAIDPENARAEDIVLVTVLPVNDPPTISGVPDLVVHYDDVASPLINYTFDLMPYVHDVDNDTSDLLITTNDSSHIFFYGGQTTVMYIYYPVGLSGQIFAVRITVSDGLEEAFQDINITVLDNWSPEVASPLPDIIFFEDMGLSNAFMIGDHFLDPDGDELTYTSLSSNVLVSIDNSTLVVDFDSVDDWFGVEYVTFRATDTFGGITEQTIQVDVLPVNDAPKILPIADLVLMKGQTYTLDLTEYVTDVDNSFSELTILVSGNHAGTPSIAGYMLLFAYSDEGTDYVRLEVSDGVYTEYATIRVSIVGPPPPSIWDQIYWPWSIITIILAGLMLAIFSRWFFARIQIDETFLIHRSGTLISHSVMEKETYVDEDIFSSMFTVIQEFIRDSFREIEDAPVRRIDFGDQKILIEKGEQVYLAVVYSGHETKRNMQPLKEALDEIESTYAGELKDWSGFLAGFAGVERILRKHLGEFDPTHDIEAEDGAEGPYEIEKALDLDEADGNIDREGGSE
ncbi:MAG: DNRLRE domain-containing protein [Thermoplasmata archaeon]|nr:DNRLRE domain-containing protein [Thermoplasmata archaeon]